MYVVVGESWLRGTSYIHSRIRNNNQEMIVAHSEKDVFEILGLPYIHPTMRNADAGM